MPDAFNTQSFAEAHAGTTDPAYEQMLGSRMTKRSALARAVSRAKTKPSKKKPKKSGGRGGKGPPAPSPSTPPAPDPLIEALVRLKYGEAERGYGDQIYASQIHQQRIPGWYDQYLEQLKGIQANANASAVALQNSMRPGLNTNPAVNTPEAQQAANARNNLYHSGLNTIGAQAQNHSGYLGTLQAAGGLGKIDALKSASNDERGLRAKLQDLLREKGDYRVAAKSDIEEAKTKSALDNAKLQIAMQEFGLDAKKVGISEKLANSLTGDRRADNRRQAAKDRADISYKGKKLALDEKKLTVGQKSKARDKELKRRAKVREENQKLRSQTTRGQALLRQYKGTLKGKKLPSRQELIDLLETSKHGISHRAASRAVDKFLAHRLDAPPKAEAYGGEQRPG